jgi:hemerythrin-like domain-containing protein
MTTNSIRGFFEQEHTEIDALIAKVDCGLPGEALPRFQEFDRRLERHMGWEENLLFPAAVKSSSELENGTIAALKLEHQHVRASKAEAMARLLECDTIGARLAIEEMLTILRSHHQIEEHLLYTVLDQLLVGPAADALLARMRAESKP